MKRSKNSVFIEFGEIDYSLYFYFYECKQNKCEHVLHCDIITTKKIVVGNFFLKLSTQFNFFSVFNQLIANH